MSRGRAAGEIRFAATGDSFITRRVPEGDPRVGPLAQLIGAADVRFTNLETVIRRDEGYPHPQPGGTWASASPEVLGDLRNYGFNLVAWANNHTLDYACGGLAATERYLDAAGLIHAGAGLNLAAAGAPKYLECRGGRVGCIAATSSFHESWIAGEQRPDMIGRPGVNPLRFQTRFHLRPERLKHLKEIARSCAINASHDLSVEEGFTRPDAEGTFRFGAHLFVATKRGEPERATTTPHPRDLRRILNAIGEARRQAALVLVSIHSHEMKDGRKDRPADFLVAFARACIDGGAHAVVGHGPHILRGIEIYKNRPIFYSLGNFIFQNETVAPLPADFYEKYELGHENTPADVFDARNRGARAGLDGNPRVWRSVVASWTMTGDELSRLELHPVELGRDQPRHRRGWPRLTRDGDALEEVQALSRDFGVDFTLRNGQAQWSPHP